MRHLPEPQRATQLSPFGHPRDHVAIVRAQELPERQEGEELRLRAIVTRESARIPRQRGPADRQCFSGELHRGLRHGAHPSLGGSFPKDADTGAHATKVSTEQNDL
jgi:hypothetical protein